MQDSQMQLCLFPTESYSKVKQNIEPNGSNAALCQKMQGDAHWSKISRIHLSTVRSCTVGDKPGKRSWGPGGELSENINPVSNSSEDIPILTLVNSSPRKRKENLIAKIVLPI